MGGASLWFEGATRLSFLLCKQGKRPEKLADCLDKLRKLFQTANQAAGVAGFAKTNPAKKETPGCAACWRRSAICCMLHYCCTKT